MILREVQFVIEITMIIEWFLTLSLAKTNTDEFMKNLLCVVNVCLSLHCLGQTTHSATVHINQPPVCTIVSTEKNIQEEPVLYPNPATKIIFIKHIEANTQVEIHDALGRNVFRNFLESENTISIDVEPFTRGIYHVIIRSQRRNVQIKAIVE